MIKTIPIIIIQRNYNAAYVRHDIKRITKTTAYDENKDETVVHYLLRGVYL